MKAIFVTRFSFYGKSGWKSEASADPEVLFSAERLERRFEMFEKITLRSLADQSDGDFEHMVLSSSFMPRPYQKRLQQVCGDHLGDRARVLFRRYKYVGQVVSNYTQETWGDEEMILQSVLDDDDAVSADFVEACHFEAEVIRKTPYAKDPITFLTFPRGFTLGLRDGETPWMANRYTPFTNLGLCILKPPAHKKNLFNISHLKVGTRYGSRVAGANRPFYIRTVHDHNDSRARHGDDLLSPVEIARQHTHFPLLDAFFGPATAGDGEKAGAKAAA